MDKKKTILAVGILGILITIFLLLNTYAYWKVENKSAKANKVSSGCLTIDYKDLTAEINITNAWPTSDEDGVSSRAYEFSVQNTCDYDVNYQIVLESLPTTAKNYMDYKDIKVQLDNESINRYDDLNSGYKDPNAGYPIRHVKHLVDGIAVAHRVYHHELRLWLASDASLDARGKEFRGKIKVFAGQGIDDPDYALSDEGCFEFDSDTGTVTAFNCGNSIVLPATIGGVLVKHIALEKELYPSTQTRWNKIDLSHASGLETIGDACFSASYNVQNEIIIPDNVKTIGNRAFLQYKGPGVTLGRSVENIGERAFENYVGRGKTLYIPATIKSIGNSAFYSFNGYRISFASGTDMDVIDGYAFTSFTGSGGEAGSILTIPKVKRVEAGAFQSFNGTQLFFSDGIEKLGDMSFYSFRGTPSFYLIIPDSVETIGNSAFANFRSSSGVSFGHGDDSHLQSIGTHAFYYLTQTVVIPSSVNRIGNSAFYSLPSGRLMYINRPNRQGMTLEPGYHGQAQVMCRENGQYITCPD